jgi:rSAM/selenodomain-associated transferase 2
MKISLIVPILNEIKILPEFLFQLQKIEHEDCEILFVDGGSYDGSEQFVANMNFTVFNSAPGRARQMNLGASKAQGEIFVFLHADTNLPSDGLEVIQREFQQERHQWGRFDVTIVGRSPWLKVVAFLMNFRSRLSAIATGDQAIFIRRSLFMAVGGFPDQPLMEDVELCRRLKAECRPVCLRERVQTSGRRWETRGVGRTVLLMWLLRWQYWRGVPPEKLALIYR